MHIPWTWAKQRPQFIALELQNYFNVQVIFKFPFFKKNQSIENDNIELLPIKLLPFNSKSLIIQYLNRILFKLKTSKLLSNSKYIWITSPDLFNLLPFINDSHVVVYDCMDDMLSFPRIKNNPKIFNFFQKNEKLLFNRANIIFCSSLNLKQKIISRYGNKKEIVVINNGITQNMFNSIQNDNIKFLKLHKDKINLVYIGTIAKWIDWNLILNSMKHNERLVYHFVGPQEMPIPNHEFILHYGPCSHKHVKKIMSEADILIMPFLIDDLIESVNPVKLYEYIFSGKPCVSVKYGESIYFEKFVYLYSSENEYIDIINKINLENFRPKTTYLDSIEFCKNNTWKHRVEQVNSILNSAQ